MDVSGSVVLFSAGVEHSHGFCFAFVALFQLKSQMIFVVSSFSVVLCQTRGLCTLICSLFSSGRVFFCFIFSLKRPRLSLESEAF